MKNINIIFLDIDGVLNSSITKEKFTGYIGIDNKNISVLKRIVKKTKAYIVLISTWKECWSKDKNKNQDLGIYLDMKLRKYGLHVSSKVNDYYPQRGSDIKRYLNLLEDRGYNPNFIIIDDELFNYYDLGYKHKLIKTSYYDGVLKKCHIKKAIKILKKGRL